MESLDAVDRALRFVGRHIGAGEQEEQSCELGLRV
jgi:hypothetical protein